MLLYRPQSAGQSGPVANPKANRQSATCGHVGGRLKGRDIWLPDVDREMPFHWGQRQPGTEALSTTMACLAATSFTGGNGGTGNPSEPFSRCPSRIRQISQEERVPTYLGTSCR